MVIYNKRYTEKVFSRYVLLSIIFLFAVCCFSNFSVAVEGGRGFVSKEGIANGWCFETDRAQVRVTAVMDNIFRITAVPIGSALSGENTTFIAPVTQPAFSLAKFDNEDKFGISTEVAILEISKDSLEFVITGKDAGTMLKNVKLNWHPEDCRHWEVTLLSPPGERNYGIGNPEMGRSGGLMKSFAQTMVGNGITQVPFVWSTAGYGMLFDFEQKGLVWKKCDGGHYWRVPGGELDFYVLLADTPYQLLDAYTDLTGKPPIPPKWTFGFMMSRWGYDDWEDIRQKWRKFRQKKIPVDVFIYDYDWFVKDWQCNNKTFPNPKENIEEASKMGIKIVGIRKPRIEDKENLEFAKSKDWILAYTKNDLDFSIPQARSWWWQKHIPVFKDGIAGWWNDEAEQTITEYYYMVQAQHDGMLAQKPNERVWTINRAFSPGLQRLGAAVWTGDINSSWEALREQPATLLNYSMTGMPYGSEDIGGFIGMPSPEMYVRWIQHGAFIPVMRAHSQRYSDRWPWAFGDEAEKAVKKAIELRYRLIPYLYSYAEKASQTGAPLMRPLFFEFPDDPRTFNMDTQWLVGNEILAAPLLEPGGKRQIYLPAETWYDFHTGMPVEGSVELSVQADLDEIPLYVRGGSILPLSPVVQYTTEKKKLPLDIHIYPGKDGSFLLYEDDGCTYAYRSGDCKRTLLSWKQAGLALTIKPAGGEYVGSSYMVGDIYLHNVSRPFHVLLNGRKLPHLKNELSGKSGWLYSSESRQVKVIIGTVSLDGKVDLEFAPAVSKLLSKKDTKGLLALLRRRKGEHRSVVLYALAQTGEMKAIAAVRQAAFGDDDQINRKAAVEAMSVYGLGDKTFFKKCLKDLNPAVRLAAVRALNKLRAEYGFFMELANDPSEEVRFASHNALEILASKGDRKAIDFLIQKLKKEDSVGKIGIINVLASQCNQENVFNEFKRLLQTPEPVIQQAILQAVKGYHVRQDYFGLFIPLTFDKNEQTASCALEVLNSYEGLKKYFGQPIGAWKVIGPFDNTNGVGFTKAYLPENRADANVVRSGVDGKVSWKDESADDGGVVNLLKAFPAHPENVCAYGLVTIKSPQERDVQLWMGSDDGIKVWLNGDLIWSKEVGRSLTRDEDKVKAKLKKGENVLLLKICQGTGAWEYTVRLVDSDGRLDEISYLLPK